jgi:hypothetical protein
LESVARFFGEHAGDDCGNLGWNVGPQFIHRSRRPLMVRDQLVDDRTSGKWRDAGEQKIKGAAQAVDIRSNIGRP